MIPAKTDPHVSCPIVCGEYMRATGFFLTANDQTYLITACRNLLPTNATKLETGNYPLTYQTHEFLPIIDIYLRDDAGFTAKRVNLRNKRGVLIDHRIDVLGIPIDIDPEEYGYVPWTLDDIEPPEATSSTLDIIGFPGRSFPDNDEYDTDTYAQQVTGPYVLTVHNDGKPNAHAPTQTGFLAFGIDTGPKKHDTEYDGYSGCPILGNGLVGIHCANVPVTAVDTDTNDTTETTAIAYWQADTLNHLFKV